MSAFNYRIEQGLHALYACDPAQNDGPNAAQWLGAALCIGSGGAPYEEARNPFACDRQEFIDFKLGWQRAAMNRQSLQKMGAIA